ncbi:DUF2795 domain-containing protein [Spirillospora albida]|uniref:DUF2795 domain-containing protein n=1 Tax=Spirillospora albida TaxID=58123 RepID=UPI0004C22384|nr:DUF2795 domain-containing protein [Spirillospora albida]
MSEQSGKHGPKLEDEIVSETEGMVRGHHATHAEEFKEPEPYADGDPSWDPGTPGADPREGSPPGMTTQGVEDRSALARLLAGVRYPARPNALIDHASDAGAPDAAMVELERLPDREYENIADIAEELGYGREERRY